MAQSPIDRSSLATKPGDRETFNILTFNNQEGEVTNLAVGPATADQLAAAMDIVPADIASASIGTSDAGGVGIERIVTAGRTGACGGVEIEPGPQALRTAGPFGW